MSAPLPSLPTSFPASDGTCNSPHPVWSANSRHRIDITECGIKCDEHTCRMRGTRNFATSSGCSAKQLMKNFAALVSAPESRCNMSPTIEDHTGHSSSNAHCCSLTTHQQLRCDHARAQVVQSDILNAKELQLCLRRGPCQSNNAHVSAIAASARL